jgi:hypothetical protein
VRTLHELVRIEDEVGNDSKNAICELFASMAFLAEPPVFIASPRVGWGPSTQTPTYWCCVSTSHLSSMNPPPPTNCQPAPRTEQPEAELEQHQLLEQKRQPCHTVMLTVAAAAAATTTGSQQQAAISIGNERPGTISSNNSSGGGNKGNGNRRPAACDSLPELATINIRQPLAN